MTGADDFPLPPEIPPPTTIAIWGGQIRAILPLLGGIGIGGAWVEKLTDAQINSYLTAILTLIGIGSWIFSAIWSRYDKWQQARKARTNAVASAVASAISGSPVTVSVTKTPSGTPDLATATRVSMVEAANSPQPRFGTMPDPAPGALGTVEGR